MYIVNYQTGRGNTTHDTIEEAKAATVPAYTQLSVLIEDEDRHCIARLPWIGMPYEEDQEDDTPHTDFGAYGYYGQWEDFDC